MFTPLTHQTSFSSVELSFLAKSRTAKFLEQVNQRIDWQKIERILEPLYCKDNGRPSFSPIALLRGLLLEQWYQLSDKALEEELKDRLSFRNFIGLNSNQDSPDETTFVRFRKKLQKNNLEETIFNTLRDNLRQDNIEIKQGKCLLTDATIIESPRGIKPKGRDGNGDYIKNKRNNWKKGYKSHLVVNQKDGLIETSILTFAGCHESRFLERTLDKVDGKISSVIGDKGYASDERKRDFKKQGIYYGILEKRKNNQKHLTTKQKQKNERLKKIRARIERIFAVVKKHYGFAKVRYFGLKNNTSHMWYVFAAYNIQYAVLQSFRTG